jgi:SAM-dependent methyltransferase
MAAVLDVLGPLRGKRVPDAGCGEGSYSLEFARRGAQVTGVDHSEAMLALARRRSTVEKIGVEWRKGDITSLAVPDASFDLVVALTVLCLVRDPRGVVRELSRVLVLGGRLVIGELHRWSLWAMRCRIRGWAGDTLWRGAQFWSVRAPGTDGRIGSGIWSSPRCHLVSTDRATRPHVGSAGSLLGPARHLGCCLPRRGRKEARLRNRIADESR